MYFCIGHGFHHNATSYNQSAQHTWLRTPVSVPDAVMMNTNQSGGRLLSDSGIVYRSNHAAVGDLDYAGWRQTQNSNGYTPPDGVYNTAPSVIARPQRSYSVSDVDPIQANAHRLTFGQSTTSGDNVALDSPATPWFLANPSHDTMPIGSISEEHNTNNRADNIAQNFSRMDEFTLTADGTSGKEDKDTASGLQGAPDLEKVSNEDDCQMTLPIITNVMSLNPSWGKRFGGQSLRRDK